LLRANHQGTIADSATIRCYELLLSKTLASLNETPLVVPGSDTRGPDIITYSDVIRTIKESVYEPLEKFSLLADVYTDVSHGNGSILQS
jgi:hypothetical protein